LTFRKCGEFLGGVIDVMNEYREEFSPRMERSRCTVEPTIHGPASATLDVFPEIRAVVLRRFSAVKYGKRWPCYFTCYPILFMSEYSNTLRRPRTPCHSVESRFAVLSFETLACHLGCFRRHETISDLYVFINLF